MPEADAIAIANAFIAPRFTWVPECVGIHRDPIDPGQWVVYIKSTAPGEPEYDPSILVVLVNMSTRQVRVLHNP